jgi:membrane associated rhomboid family serine protease
VAVSVTILLIALTCLLSWMAMHNARLMDRLILWPPAIQKQHQYDRLITHGFVHADLSHLLFNMITLYFFGRLIERFFAQYIGQVGFALFYLSALLVAILPTYLRHRNDARYRSLGASGAVSAVLFAFILLKPWSIIYVFIVPVPAIVYGVIYVGYSYWMDRRGSDNINHSAHLWGAGYGVLFSLLLEPRIAGAFVENLLHPSMG